MNLIHSIGSDPTKLGRWNWIDLIHNQMKIRIIIAYRYVKSCQSNNIVYMQQERYYRLKQLSICPLIAFREDISKFLSKTLSDGFDIILSINTNENI